MCQWVWSLPVFHFGKLATMHYNSSVYHAPAMILIANATLIMEESDDVVIIIVDSGVNT